MIMECNYGGGLFLGFQPLTDCMLCEWIGYPYCRLYYSLCRLTTSTAEVRSTQHKSQYRGPIRKRISAQWYKQQRKDIVNIQYITTYYKTVRTAIPTSTPYFDKKTQKKQPGQEHIKAPTSAKTIHPSQTVVKSTIGITDPFTQHTVSQRLKS